MLRRALSDPLFLLLLFTALLTFLIQSGELGTSDTTHRLQVAHSFWTGEPQISPDDDPQFKVHGRGGRLYAPWGIGQSLLLFPADLAGSALARLPLWRSYVDSQADPTITNIFVSITTNILVSVLTAFTAFHFLGLLGFSVRESIAGTLTLLCATTHLHYAQNMTENNYILLLTLAGMTLQYKWFKTDDRRALIYGSAALGLNLLTRITTAIDILGAGCLLLLVAHFARHYSVDKVRTYLRTTIPIYTFFFLLDRIYQYLRFGSWTTTYMSALAREQRLANPAFPASYPFNGHWFQGGVDSGVLGPLFAPAKSIFLFDPVFPLTLLLSALLWKRLPPPAKAFLVATLVLVLAYILFYARYYSWAGDFAWGDRYVSSAVELASLSAVPLLLRFRGTLRPGIVRLSLFITALSVVIQTSSLAFWLPLEIYQATTPGYRAWVLLLRLRNIAAFVLGKRAAWGIDTPATLDDPWDVAHLSAWNFLPSLLRHIGAAPLWAVHLVDAIWIAVALALVLTTARLLRLVSSLSDPLSPEAHAPRP